MIEKRAGIMPAILALLLLFVSAWAFMPGQAFGDAPETQALEHKGAGDGLAQKEDYKGAAGEYAKALFISREAFTRDERTRMAAVMSWGGDLNGAIEELSILKSEEPSTEVLKPLARTLSWAGRLDEAALEIDAALALAPDDREALVIKGNILRWQGRFQEAVSVYEGVLAGGEDFDARIGLSYALLGSGEMKAAAESAKGLRPGYGAQEKELEDLERTLRGAAAPGFDALSSYYSDSDSNRSSRHALIYSFPVSGFRGALALRSARARDDSRRSNAEAFHLSVTGRLSEALAAGAGAGAVSMGGSRFLTGHISASGRSNGWDVSAAVSKDVLADTALLMENRIRLTDYSASASKTHGKASISGALSLRRYSDDNSAVDLSITPMYALRPGNPKIDIGYRLRYLDFERQAGSGYFDPDWFVSHQVLAALRYEKEAFYALLEPYFGNQSFERNGNGDNDFFWGGAGVAGYRVGKAAVELRAEGGNYAVGSAAGFNYYTAGLKLILAL
ncbi:MAG: hypothetical protein HS130_11825 [Deltaproteobacteria bacterium]|nr:hypothetical protein [Deltaproteobacteria bacterium]MCL4873682.1 hypothetical protein [bacterium]